MTAEAGLAQDAL